MSAEEQTQPITIYVSTDKARTTYRINPNAFYNVVRQAIASFMGGGATTGENARLASLVRVAVKGVLLMYGDKILDSMFGGKDHPKPQRGDDLVDWYTDMFAKVGIAMWMKSDTHLNGRVMYSEETIDGVNVSVIQIDEVYTRSNAETPTD